MILSERICLAYSTDKGLGFTGLLDDLETNKHNNNNSYYYQEEEEEEENKILFQDQLLDLLGALLLEKVFQKAYGTASGRKKLKAPVCELKSTSGTLSIVRFTTLIVHTITNGTFFTFQENSDMLTSLLISVAKRIQQNKDNSC